MSGPIFTERPTEPEVYVLVCRRIRVIYNQGADEAVVVTVMLRRTEGGGS